MSFALPAYLERIGIGPVRPDMAGLFALQEAQLHAVPFENLDPLLGKVPELGLDAVFDKIVLRRRGGYCFELNGLFEAALKASGFGPRRMLARVRMRTGTESPRSHLVLRVEAEGRAFLADAGFGGPGALAPIELDVPGEQQAPNGAYRLTDDRERGETVLERLGDEGWEQLYAFDGARVSDGEVATANYVCATWPEAPFGSHATLGCYRGEIRYGLFDRALTIEGGAGATHRQLADFGEFAALVQDEMGIALEREDLARAWEKIAPPEG